MTRYRGERKSFLKQSWMKKLNRKSSRSCWRCADEKFPLWFFYVELCSQNPSRFDLAKRVQISEKFPFITNKLAGERQTFKIRNIQKCQLKNYVPHMATRTEHPMHAFDEHIHSTRCLLCFLQYPACSERRQAITNEEHNVCLRREVEEAVKTDNKNLFVWNKPILLSATVKNA